MALIISSILGDYTIENYDELANRFTDISSQYENQILKSYAAGILTGYGDNTFRPDKTLTRAEAATVIYRFIDESKRIYPTVGGVVEEQKPLAEMITNYKSFIMDDGETIDKLLARTETYEIITDSNCGIYVKDGFYGAKSLRFPIGTELYGGIKYLIKDNKVVDCIPAPLAKGEIEQTASITGIDITIMDYIASLNTSTYHMTIVVNPFKK